MSVPTRKSLSNLERALMSKINPDDIGTFTLELHDFLVMHPLITETEEGFDHLLDFVEQRFEKFWSHLIGEQNYN